MDIRIKKIEVWIRKKTGIKNKFGWEDLNLSKKIKLIKKRLASVVFYVSNVKILNKIDFNTY